jgi:hypothetical protein
MAKESDLLELWLTNEEFRAAMRQDPRAALGTFLELEVAPEVQIQLHETKDINEVHLVLPAVPTLASEREQQYREIHRNESIECASEVKGGTCWNTPNCPTNGTCKGSAC